MTAVNFLWLSYRFQSIRDVYFLIKINY